MTSGVPQRYSASLIGLHWLTLALIIGVYACMELREFWPKGSPTREALKGWHFTLGLTVFVVMLVRIAMRLASPTPPITPRPAQWRIFASKSIQIALYALLLIMPIAGWTILSAEAKPIPFWFFDLPSLTSENKDFAKFVEEWHEIGSKVGYGLIAVHAAAAVFHHYVLKDNALLRMLPERRS